MSLPYTLVEKSVLRKPNSEKTIGTVLTDSIAWMNSLEEGNSVTNFFYYAEVIDSDTRMRYFVYSDEAVQYFGLADNIVEADVAGSASNGNTVPVQEMPAYSEEEVLTTERWIDGKPIYRKVFISVGLISDDLGVIVKALMSIKRDNENRWDTGSLFIDNDTKRYFNIIDNKLEDVFLSGGYEADDWYITIEYTKNTDTAESPVAQLSIPEYKDIYSTEETLTNKVWMGKAVYRKLVELGDISYLANDDNIGKEVSFGIDNIDTQISVLRYGNMNDASEYHYSYTNQYRDDVYNNSFVVRCSVNLKSVLEDVNFIVEYTKL